MDVKQIIVMRTDLGMRKGKMIAQGAHASMSFLVKHSLDASTEDAYTALEFFLFKLTKPQQEWLLGSFTKVCVRVNSEEELFEIFNKAREANLETHLITDSGRTEFAGVPTNTCCAIGPDESEKIDKITGHLALL